MLNGNERKVEVTNVFRRIEKAKEQTVVLPGGAGSSKSYSLTQFFIFRRLLVRRGYRLLVLRKTRKSNKLSAYKEFIDMLQRYGIYNEKCHNKSDLIYQFLDNYVLFAGLDDREKIKSTQWHDIWIEESYEFSREDYLFLLPRLYRGALVKGVTPRIYMSFNPFDCWIFDLEGQPKVKFIWSNYKDNPFLNPEYIETLNELENQDQTYYNVYALGRRGVLKDLIYKPYIMETVWPEEFEDGFYGLDFGYNNPSALIEIAEKDAEYWLTEKLYQTKLTNTMLIEKLKELIPEEKLGWPIYADNAEPARIEEISQAGFIVYPAEKSVKDGIDLCKSKVFHTRVENENLNSERGRYKYKEDSKGNILDDPVKFHDHLMDAKRYGIYTHCRGQGVPNIRRL